MRTKQNFLDEIVANAVCVQQGIQLPPEPIFYDWNFFITDTTPEPPHIIGKGILPQKSLAQIAGEPKVGKSHLAVSLAYYMATGTNWFHFPIVKPQRVLLLQAENSYFNQRGRIQLINEITHPPYNLPKIPDKQLIISDPIHNLNINEEGGYNRIESLLLQHEVDVMIVDPLVNFHTAEENSNSEMAHVMDRFHKLKDDTNTSIILIHHTRKPNGDDSGGMSHRGASAIRGAYDTGMTLTAKYDQSSGQHYHQLEFELRNGPPQNPLTLVLDEACLVFNTIDIVKKNKDFILETLHAVREEGMKQNILVNEGVIAGFAKATLHRSIKSLISQRLIISSKDQRNIVLHLPEYLNTLELNQ